MDLLLLKMEYLWVLTYAETSCCIQEVCLTLSAPCINSHVRDTAVFENKGVKQRLSAAVELFAEVRAPVSEASHVSTDPSDWNELLTRGRARQRDRASSFQH